MDPMNRPESDRMEILFHDKKVLDRLRQSIREVISPDFSSQKILPCLFSGLLLFDYVLYEIPTLLAG